MFRVAEFVSIEPTGDRKELEIPDQLSAEQHCGLHSHLISNCTAECCRIVDGRRLPSTLDGNGQRDAEHDFLGGKITLPLAD